MNTAPLCLLAPEPYLTLKEAAGTLRLPYWKLQRAVKAGRVPSYAPFNKRRLVLLSEIIAYINGTRTGGAQ